MTVRMNCDADDRVVSAIGDGDVVRLAQALRSGGATARSSALKLLIAVLTRRSKDALVIMPARKQGQRTDHLLDLASRVRALDLRRGFSPDLMAELILRLESGHAWIGVKRAAKRGPRADRAHISKLLVDGGRVQREIENVAFGDACARAKGLPIGSVISVDRTARGVQRRAFEAFLSSSKHLGMSYEDGLRYAKRALKEARAFDKETK